MLFVLRLTITENNDLPNVLAKLLPKLIPMANQEPLRESVFKILSSITKRCKLLRIKLPCPELLEMITPEMAPYASNLAIAFLDIGISFEADTSRIACAASALKSISRISYESLFKTQAMSLAIYAIYFLLEVFQVLSLKNAAQPSYNNSDLELVNFFVSDLCLDYALCPVGIRRNAAGSASNGLSVERAHRILAKKESIPNDEMQKIKKIIVASLYDGILDSRIVVSIALILVLDSDPEVSRQSIFKQNGMRNFLHSKQYDISEVLSFLFALCTVGLKSKYLKALKDGNNTSECRTYYLSNRSSLRDDQRIGILSWIAKEMSDHLMIVSNQILCYFSILLDEDDFFSQASKNEKCAIVTLMDVFCSKRQQADKLGAMPDVNQSHNPSFYNNHAELVLSIASKNLKYYAEVTRQVAEVDLKLREVSKCFLNFF